MAGLQCAASRRGHVSLGLWRVGVHLAVVMSVAIILPCVPPARRMPCGDSGASCSSVRARLSWLRLRACAGRTCCMMP